jgi:hypothetical protein
MPPITEERQREIDRTGHALANVIAALEAANRCFSQSGSEDNQQQANEAFLQLVRHARNEVIANRFTYPGDHEIAEWNGAAGTVLALAVPCGASSKLAKQCRILIATVDLNTLEP